MNTNLTIESRRIPLHRLIPCDPSETSPDFEGARSDNCRKRKIEPNECETPDKKKVRPDFLEPSPRTYRRSAYSPGHGQREISEVSEGIRDLSLEEKRV